MSKKQFKAENTSVNEKGKKDKPKHPLQKISSGISKAQAERMAKYSK
ncbi:hypothetical protein J32TS6_12350 [Virgibacillus pantothenticus]|nr:hypothetical protein [Virgibacillus pantothenticus]GIP62680.1 hypothetical protein J32TS6_12350 [Virgibacillus pantothenticus]